MAHDDEVKRRRREVVTIPMKLDSQGAAMIQAANLAAVARRRRVPEQPDQCQGEGAA
ncbi:MAG: hypothetical protein R2709_01205 [Marmoricola sp.]